MQWCFQFLLAMYESFCFYTVVFFFSHSSGVDIILDIVFIQWAWFAFLWWLMMLCTLLFAYWQLIFLLLLSICSNHLPTFNWVFLVFYCWVIEVFNILDVGHLSDTWNKNIFLQRMSFLLIIYQWLLLSRCVLILFSF